MKSAIDTIDKLCNNFQYVYAGNIRCLPKNYTGAEDNKYHEIQYIIKTERMLFSI